MFLSSKQTISALVLLCDYTTKQAQDPKIRGLCVSSPSINLYYHDLNSAATGFSITIPVISPTRCSWK